MSASGNLVRATSLGINDTRIAGLYNLEHTIGKGNFAVVKLARHVFTDEKVAVKVIDKTRLDPISAAHMMQEVRCMKLVQHPNIVRLYEIIDTQTKLFLILELGDYDMYDYIMKKGFDKGGCKESEAQQYFSQIIKAIDYCHKLHVVHRDLKPENVVFFEKIGMVKLTDFGFSNMYTPGERLETSCGSLAYSAPEILLGDPYDAPAVDIWSIGVLLFMLVCGKLPFQEANESETLTRILDCKFSLPSHISPACRHLIARMLVRDPENRATLAEIKSSPWVIAGDRGHAEVLPLIAKDQLPESAHCTIIEQMVAGGIGTEEGIVNAIESGDYSYMTATYYLLAERVLASYRLEQANRLVGTKTTCAEIDHSDGYGGLESADSSSSGTLVSGSGCSAGGSGGVGKSRSRSNSWRGTISTKRACTMVKEESEEELTSYLRTSSRQSSRFYSGPSVPKPPEVVRLVSHQLSGTNGGANSLDSFTSTPKPLSIVEDQAEEEEEESGESVSSRRGRCWREGVLFPDAVETPNQMGSLAPIHEYGDATSCERMRSASGTGSKSEVGTPVNQLGTFMFPHSTAPPTPSTKARRYHAAFYALTSASRRNSSPSVSMLAGVTGNMHSSRERVSPQAIQELLEYSRLSSNTRRAASPESRISSRSSSPSCTSHSGRTSPAVLSLASRLKATSLLPGSGGMRKLSSSPHLLGICEESEEGAAESPTQGTGTFRQHNLHGGGASHSGFSSVTLSHKTSPSTRSSRSASMGLAANIRLRRSVDAGSGLSISFDSSITPLSRSFLLKRGDVKFPVETDQPSTTTAAVATSPSPLLAPSSGRQQKKHAFKKHIILAATPHIEPLTETTEEAALAQGGCEVELDNVDHMRREVTESSTMVTPSPQS